MADTFTEVTTRGYGSRIINSIGGILFGVILFLGSFVLLYWNEGRVDMSIVAKTATEISADQAADPALIGKLVAASGSLTTEQTLADEVSLSEGKISLKGDKFVALNRQVEMYAWEESSTTESHKNVGGSETSETTYTYKQQWTDSPEDSSKFRHPEGHQNPPLRANSKTLTASDAKIGLFGVDAASVDLPTAETLTLNSENIVMPAGVVLDTGNHVYIGKNSQTPTIGDLRIGYSVVRSGTRGLIFGNLKENSIVPYLDNQNNKLYRIFTGSKDEAVATLHGEYTMIIWILRLIGFVLMWAGLGMIFAPITVLLDVLPILGRVSGSLIGIASFLVALVLSAVTILISMLFHNIYALIVVVILVGGGLALVLPKLKKPAAPQMPPSNIVPPTTPTQS